MGQEFFIKDANLEAKVRQLLPSQGGLGAGQDLSASTQIIPIVDLTESAEGSNLRADLQTALTLTSANEYAVSGTTSTIITNTGFWRVFGTSTLLITGSQRNNTINVTDGVTTKAVYRHTSQGGVAGPYLSDSYDFVIKLEAGESITVTGSIGGMTAGSIRQIADIDGNLINA